MCFSRARLVVQKLCVKKVFVYAKIMKNDLLPDDIKAIELKIEPNIKFFEFFYAKTVNPDMKKYFPWKYFF
jgi:hypothetical protein